MGQATRHNDTTDCRWNAKSKVEGRSQIESIACSSLNRIHNEYSIHPKGATWTYEFEGVMEIRGSNIQNWEEEKGPDSRLKMCDWISLAYRQY